MHLPRWYVDFRFYISHLGLALGLHLGLALEQI